MTFFFNFSVETASTSLLHSVMASQGPNLTPTLQIYYRPELIKHISDWGVERLERDVSFYLNF